MEQPIGALEATETFPPVRTADPIFGGGSSHRRTRVRFRWHPGQDSNLRRSSGFALRRRTSDGRARSSPLRGSSLVRSQVLHPRRLGADQARPARDVRGTPGRTRTCGDPRASPCGAARATVVPAPPPCGARRSYGRRFFIPGDQGPTRHAPPVTYVAPRAGLEPAAILGLRPAAPHERRSCPLLTPTGLVARTVAGLHPRRPGADQARPARDVRGTPGRTRTCDRRIRNPMLYPAELPGPGSGV